MMRLGSWPAGWTTRFEPTWASEPHTSLERWAKTAAAKRPHPEPQERSLAQNPKRPRGFLAEICPSGTQALIWLITFTLGARTADIPRQSVSVNAVTSPATNQVSHTTRRMAEEEVRALLTQCLQQRTATEGAEWELRFLRPWTPVNVPDGMLSLRLLEPALDRIAPTCILRFELRANDDFLGSWQVPVQAHLWREVLVAHAPLARGLPLADAALEHQRCDVLTLRAPIYELPADTFGYELAESVPAGGILTARAVRLRPVVFRGQTADAIVRQGAMLISLKVEVLEEGALGQVVRVRNSQTRRELRGKVQDERTIAIAL